MLATDPIIAREGQLQMFLRSMKDKKVFTKEVHEKIYPIALNWCLYMGHLKLIS